MLTPAAGATDGATANFQMTASGTGAPTDKEKITVKVADGPDLVVSPSDNEIATTPGARTALAYTFTNTGSEDATDIVETFFFTHGFVPDAFDNCEYEPLDFIGGTAAICTFDGSLAPSAGASVNFTGSVGDDAADMELASSDVYTNLTMSDFEKNAFARKTRGAIAKHFAPRSHSGKKLALKKASSARSADDIDLSDNFAFVILDVKTSHDAVVGDYALKGAVGDTSTAYLIMKNDGPASLNFVNGEEISALLITVPQFAEVTKVPSDCGGLKSPSADPFTGARGKPGYRYYACLDETDLYLPAGGLLRYAFEFKITKDHGADGSYKILPKTAAANGDSDLSNNTAKISLNLTGDGSLPVTGSKVGIIGGVGGALVLLGGVLLVLGRRRKRAAAV
jgi:LPXTG-motif cell wall-anchored protein